MSWKVRNSDLRWNRRPMSCSKFPVQIVRGVILEKPAELLIPEKKKEHLRNNKTAAKGSRIANHAWSNNHVIDFDTRTAEIFFAII